MKKIFLLFAVGALLLTSCEKDMLDTRPTDRLDARDFVDSASVEAFKVGMYGSLGYRSGGSLYNAWLPLYSDWRGDDMIYGNTWYQGMNSIYDYTTGSTSGTVSTLWSECYYFQEIANSMIAKDLSMLSKTRADRYKAEAKAMRAMVYVDVARWFGKAYHLDGGASKALPYLKVVDYKALPKRNTMKEIYAFAIQDLTEAIPFLFDRAETSASIFSKEAAYTVLAWIYADMHDDANAIKYAKLAVAGNDKATAGELTANLMPSSEFYLGLSNITSETIWAAVSDKDNYSKWRNFTSFHDNYDGMGDDNVASAEIFEKFSATDLRKRFFCIEWDGEDKYPYRDMYNDPNVTTEEINNLSTTWSVSPGYYLSGKFPRKDVQFNKSRGTLGLGEYSYMRKSELVLLIADLEYSSNEAEAKALLDAIQRRADNSVVASTNTGIALRNEIRLERRKELLGEGHSYRDILRYGEGLTRVATGHTANTLSLPAGDPRFQLPVPESEVNANPNILN